MSPGYVLFLVLLPGLLAAIPGFVGVATRRPLVGSLLMMAGPLFVWFIPYIFPIFVFSIIMSLYQWGLALLFIPVAFVVVLLTPQTSREVRTPR